MLNNSGRKDYLLGFKRLHVSATRARTALAAGLDVAVAPERGLILTDVGKRRWLHGTASLCAHNHPNRL